MDLKFTFGGASPDHHDHGGAPSAVPLPFTTSSGGSSSVLEVRARLEDAARDASEAAETAQSSGTRIIAEALSGDGVAYSTAAVALTGAETADLARALRSALSRAVAGLEGPLVDSITALVVDLGGAELEALAELGVDTELPVLVVPAALQQRIGVAESTPIRLGA
ncbi:hypothetical protein [Leucobacter sp. gxy201]|uniref:hypothetical protein n=1 Tax=Leucobacter sp. gxy201 TaxID=2957200 RepID=UPI003DA10236